MKLDDRGLRKAFNILAKSEKPSKKAVGALYRVSGGLYGERALKKAIGIDIPKRDVSGIARNLEVLSGGVKLSSAKSVARAVLDVLRASQILVPHDTGELKASGKAMIGLRGGAMIDIGWGNPTYGSDKIRTDLRKITAKKVKDVKKAKIGAVYIRENLEGQDIALWTHENLHPYGKAKARKEGTGPKYLEIPFNEIKEKLDTLMEAAINDFVKSKIRRIRKIQKRAAYKYDTTVEDVKLVESLLDSAVD